jgi:hypothetical protein
MIFSSYILVTKYNLQLTFLCNMLPATQCFVALGNIGNKETSFNPFRGNNAIESRSSSTRFLTSYEKLPPPPYSQVILSQILIVSGSSLPGLK